MRSTQRTRAACSRLWRERCSGDAHCHVIKPNFGDTHRRWWHTQDAGRLGRPAPEAGVLFDASRAAGTHHVALRGAASGAHELAALRRAAAATRHVAPALAALRVSRPVAKQAPVQQATHQRRGLASASLPARRRALPAAHGEGSARSSEEDSGPFCEELKGCRSPGTGSITPLAPSANTACDADRRGATWFTDRQRPGTATRSEQPHCEDGEHGEQGENAHAELAAPSNDDELQSGAGQICCAVISCKTPFSCDR
jgi:hypothetical protein